MAPRPLNSNELTLLRSYRVCLQRTLPIADRHYKSWSPLRPCTVMHCNLYRLFDSTDVLVYVGITCQPLAERWKRHRREKDWWSEVGYARVECHPAEHLALIAERAAIMAERPRFNVRSAVA